MKRAVLMILMFVFTITVCNAQQLWKTKRWEASGGAGASFLMGDIGGFSQGENILGLKDLSFLQTRFDINGSVKFRIIRSLNARISMTYGLFHTSDQRGSNESRSYESTTSAFEPALIGEYYFIKNSSEKSYLFLKGRGLAGRDFFGSLDFYAFTGIGGIAYSVKGNDALIERGMKTGGFAAVIPVGIGTALIYSPNLNLGLELGGRYAFTDYLDGYHNPQYSKANDVYYFLNFTVTYKLKTGRNGLPTFR